MADISTGVLIIGTGPAGSSMAALLSTYGVENMVINRYRWLANTPRAHITNQRTMEVLRDLGRDVEDEAYMHATQKELMGENVFCTSLSGEEIGRLKTWGTHPNSAAEHLLSSPTFMNDLPQTFMEPLLFKTACSRGTQARMNQTPSAIWALSSDVFIPVENWMPQVWPKISAFKSRDHRSRISRKTKLKSGMRRRIA